MKVVVLVVGRGACGPRQHITATAEAGDAHLPDLILQVLLLLLHALGRSAVACGAAAMLMCVTTTPPPATNLFAEPARGAQSVAAPHQLREQAR